MKFLVVTSLILAFSQTTSLADEEIRELKTATGSLGQRISNNRKNLEDLLKELDSIGSKMENAKNSADKSPQKTERKPEAKDSNRTKSLDNANQTEIYSNDSDLSAMTSDSPIDSRYILRASYALSFPMDTDFNEYQMKYDWGHHAELSFYRNWDKFFLGLSVGAKIFENKEISIPYSVGNLELPASGSNYSAFTSLSIGIEHFLNNHTFITANAGLGFGMAWDEISVGDVLLFDDNDYFIYGKLQLGIGYVINDTFTLLALYQLDGQGSRNNFDNQYFNQVGLSLGIHY